MSDPNENVFSAPALEALNDRVREIEVEVDADSAVEAFTADEGNTFVVLTVAGAANVPVPSDATAAIPLGRRYRIMQHGAGQLTVTAGAGATLRVSGLTAKTRAQYSVLTVEKFAANSWVVSGDVAAS